MAAWCQPAPGLRGSTLQKIISGWLNLGLLPQLSIPPPPNRPYHPLRQKCSIYAHLSVLPAVLGCQAATFPSAPLSWGVNQLAFSFPSSSSRDLSLLEFWGRSYSENKIKWSQTKLLMWGQSGYWLSLPVTHFLALLLKAVSGLDLVWDKLHFWKLFFGAE